MRGIAADPCAAKACKMQLWHSTPTRCPPPTLPACPLCCCSMTDVDVLSAAMRAGCIIVSLDLVSRRPPVATRAGSAHSATPSALGTQPLETGPGDSLPGQGLARAVHQWLQDTGLMEELPPAAPLLLQVCSRARVLLRV